MKARGGAVCACIGLTVVLALLEVAPAANADLKAHSHHSIYRDFRSKQLALPLPTASRPTLRRLHDGKLRVSFKVHYRAANWLHKGKAAPDRVMVTLEVARDLHSTGPDPVAPLFRKVFVHTLWKRNVTRHYTFDLPAKLRKKLASRGLFAGGRARRARAARHVWVDIEQDRDYQSVDGSYDWREGSAATATIAPRHVSASNGRTSARASAVPIAHASATGSIAENTCRGDTSHPCGYLTVRNETANGIYCPSGAGNNTTNGQACGNFGNGSGSNLGPATVKGTMNQMGVNVGVAGSAVQCFVEGSEGNQPSNPVGFSNVDAEGNPQPYEPGIVSVSPGGSPEVASTGMAVTEPIVANDTAQLASANEIAGVSGYMQGALNLVWGAASFVGVPSPNVLGVSMFALDADFPTPGAIVMAVLGIAKGVIEDSCDGNTNSMALAATEPGGGAASATFSASKEGWDFLNTSSANGLQLAPSSTTYSPSGSTETETATPLYLSMYAHGGGVQGSVAGGVNTNEVDLVWTDYNPCRQKSNMWGEALEGISATSERCNATPPSSPVVSSTYGEVECGPNNYECPFPAAGFPPPGDTASSTGVVKLPNGPSNCGTTIPSGTIMNYNDSYTSPNGEYSFVMQGDGNLVLYHNGVGATWAANTADSEQKNEDGGVKTILQSDGNIQVIDSKNNVLWESDTAAGKHSTYYEGATISVQNDGNVVLYETPTNGNREMWETQTNNGQLTCPNAQPQPPIQVTTNGCATIMPAGLAMTPGATITSPNGDYTLTMQAGGALVLTGAGTLWSSTQTPTLRHATSSGALLPGSSAALSYGSSPAVTGNLAVETSSSQIAFQTNTNNTSADAAPETPGQSGFDYLAVQNDGNLKLYNPFGLRALWASETLQVGATHCPAPGQVLSPAY
jgi:hypothetical protein